ncbi:MAG: hypothetical protein EBY15_01205 [Gammaproteobacteria bacterium]|nr:hypothetical protein [Gammaproteobacteria bacterium]
MHPDHYWVGLGRVRTGDGGGRYPALLVDEASGFNQLLAQSVKIIRHAGASIKIKKRRILEIPWRDDNQGMAFPLRIPLKSERRGTRRSPLFGF